MSEPPLQIFPALDSATEAALRASIERFGVLVPVAVDQHGHILDGHHRSRIAGELGVDYRRDIIRVESDDQAREIALTLNTDRRQLEPEQRREIVAALREQGHSLRAIAGAVGVSDMQVRRDLSGATSVAPDWVIGRDGKQYLAKPTVLPAKNRREADRGLEAAQQLPENAPAVLDVKRAERINREQAAAAKRAEPTAPSTSHGDIEIRHGDFREVLAGLTNVDAIITDPPYPAEYVELFDGLGQLAKRVLTKDGVLAAMTGQSYLPAYIEHLGRHLTYRWTGAYVVEGQAVRVHQRAVGTKWKPVLIYGGSRFLTQDTFHSAGDDKRHHHWGQSESGMAALVEAFTDPGDLVVDPFLGGGTTAAVCRDLGRRFIGCDTDPAAIHTTRERLGA